MNRSKITYALIGLIVLGLVIRYLVPSFLLDRDINDFHTRYNAVVNSIDIEQYSNLEKYSNEVEGLAELAELKERITNTDSVTNKSSIAEIERKYEELIVIIESIENWDNLNADQQFVVRMTLSIIKD